MTMSLHEKINRSGPARFAGNWVGGANGSNRSLRRRLMAVLRMAHRALGLGRNRLGHGMLGLGGSVACVGVMAAAMLMVAQPALAQNYTAGGGTVQAGTVNNIAIGCGGFTATVTAATGGMAIGCRAVSSGTNSIAQGVEANASGSSSVSIGTSSTASGLRGVAMGTGATASGLDSVAHGTNVIAGAQNAVAMGFQSTASALNSIYLGARTVVGTGALAQSAIAIGTDVTASGTDAIAMGRQTVSVANSVAIGALSSVTGGGSSVAIGVNSAVTASSSVAIGNTATAGGDNAVSMGILAEANGLRSVAVGAQSIASGPSAFAGGNTAVASGQSSLALGNNANATNFASMALGLNSISGGSGSIAIGPSANSMGFQSIAIGDDSQAAASGTALGGLSAATGNNATALGRQTTASGDFSVAVGNLANATAADAIAMGDRAASSQSSAIAIGRDATAGAINAIVLGVDTNANATNAVAISALASATALNALAIGTSANASADNAIAMGNTAVADAADAVAIGNGSTATGGKAVSIGSGNFASGNGAVAIGDPNTATGDGAVAQGMDNTATGDGSVAMGNTNMVGGGGQGVSVAGTAAQGAVGIGYQNTVIGQGSVALGNTSSALAAGSLAFGDTAIANNAGDVALGSGSVTAAAVATPSADINGVTYNFAGTSPTSTVSVGAVGAERTITNVAAGRISATSTDAVNGSQLFATNQAITAVGTDLDTLGTSVATALGGTSVYNTTTNQVTAGLVVGGTTYNNVQSAISAVNGTASTGWFVQANGDAVTNVAPGGTVQFLNGQNIAVTRSGTNVTIATTPALTADSLTLSSGQVFNASGLNMNGTTITGLADGIVSSTSTEAINGSQLYGVSQSISSILGGGSVVNPDGTISNPSYTIGGNTYTTVSDAFNAIGGDLSIFNNALNGGGIKYFRANSTLADSSADGTDSVAIGPQSVSTGDNSLAAGSNAQAAANQSVALGQNTQSTVLGSVALGSGSVSDRAVASTSGSITSGTGIIPYNTTDKSLLGAVSVGNATSYRQITNVADGTEDQDAVTLRQLKGALSSFAVSPTKYFHANSSASDSLAVGQDSVAIGPRTTVNGDNGIGMGNGAIVDQIAPGGTAIGQNAHVMLADGVALGTNSTAAGIQSMALGAGATANEPGSVALGSGSTTAEAVGTESATINGVEYTFAGTAPTSTVSIGSVGRERTLTNVAAGRISETSTDAVNGSQLYATNMAVNSLGSQIGNIGQTAANSVQYDTVVNPDGSVTKTNNITLQGADPNAPVLIRNVAAGVAETDAVNLKQLDDGMANTLAESQNYADQVGATTLEEANAYTDSRLSQLNMDFGEAQAEARHAAAIGLAAASLRYDDRPGKLSVAVGAGYWRDRGAMAFGAGYTSENGRVRANVSGTTAGGKWGVGAGMSLTLN